MPLLEVYPCKWLEVMRVEIRGRPRIIWRDAVTKRFVEKHTIKITVVVECEEYEEIPRKRLQVHGFCEYYLDPDPERSIAEQVDEIVDILTEEVEMTAIDYGFGAFLEYCEDTGRLKKDWEVEPDEYYNAELCECHIKWRHSPDKEWREERWFCTI